MEVRMLNGRKPPRRMRYSIESRLRVVGLIEQGMAPGVAAAAAGGSRASAFRGAGGVCGSPVAAGAPAAAAVRPRRTADPGRQGLLAGRAGGDRWPAWSAL